jgi:trans-2,3-dihydro-3-hydroxyanthranilate isomerase
MRRYPFAQWDVFASKPLEGNPLAVFPDGRGLSDAEMQAIAREMNLSETTFILPRDPATEAERGVRVRIFTTEEELPFAGHPTLGTAMALRAASGSAPAEIALELGVGRIPVAFSEGAEGIFGEMRQRDPDFGALHSAGDVATVAGLAPEDISPEWPIQTVSTGVPFAIVPLASLDAIRRVELDWRRMRRYADQKDGVFSFFFVTRETVDPEAHLHARMIFSNGEDPATGSASGCCAAWAVRYGVIPPDEQAMIEQGIEVRRPSHIYVRASRDGDRVTNVRVGGYAVEVLRGEVRL